MSRRLEVPTRSLAVLMGVTLALLLAWAVPAQAQFGISSFSVKSIEADGSESTQAGAHPFATVVDFKLNETAPDELGQVFADGNVRDVVVDMPAGYLGNPNVVATCPRNRLPAVDCPPASQVGVVTLTMNVGANFQETLPVFNMVHGPGLAADFGFSYLGIPIHIEIGTPADNGYRVRSTVRGISEAYPVVGTKLTLWGAPAAPVHDAQRGPNFRCYTDSDDPSCRGSEFGGGFSAGVALRPFLTNPTFCGQDNAAQIRARSYQDPGTWVGASAVAASGPTGCEQLSYAPTLSVQPSGSTAGSPAGLSVDLEQPYNESTSGLAVPSLRRASVTLPAGVAISSPSAAGLGACTDAESGVGSSAPVSCPNSSKIGNVQIDTPLLAEPLSGSVFLGTQQSSDPLSGDMYRLFLVAESAESGVSIRLGGRIHVDPQTGQLRTVFDQNPQLPFTRMHLEFKDGQRAPLTMPSTCGTFTTVAELTPWALPDAVPSLARSSFTIDQNCGASSQFAPGFEAGSVNPVAGASSPFTLRVTREDGQQNISRIDATLPEGLLAKLAGVPLCGDGGAASGNCPAASQIGSSTVGLGAGSSPLYVPQSGKAPTAVYLAGPYKGAPYSLVVKVPAQAGPFDLGMVAVRSTISLDPTSAQVSVKSDPLPQILQGIPLSYRDVRVEIGRSGFMQNPTSCSPMSVQGTIASAQGKSANVSDRFQVANCASLGFTPKLSLSLKGPTKRAKYPALRAVLAAKPGQANIGRVSVALPKSAFLAQNHIRTVCTRVQFAADQCPPGSIYGKATATTPLLDQPLSGPVYLRSSNNPLPDLVAALDGQIEIDLVGRIDSVNGGIRTSFDQVPDAPVSKFVLSMKGGKKGLLVNSRNLCKSTNRAKALIDGQNGKAADQRPVLSNSCGKKEEQRR